MNEFPNARPIVSLRCVVGRLLAAAIVVAIIRLASSNDVFRNLAREIYLAGVVLVLGYYIYQRLRLPSIKRRQGIVLAFIGCLAAVAKISLAAVAHPLRGAKIRPEFDEYKFSYKNKSNHVTIAVIIIVILCVEIPITQLILSGVSKIPEAARFYIEIYLTIMSVIGLLLVIGDWRLIGDGCHYMDGNTFFIRLGGRCSGDVPLVLIESVEILSKVQSASIHGSCAKVPPDLQIISLADRPNVLLSLSSPIYLKRFGVDVCCRKIALFLDSPNALIDHCVPPENTVSADHGHAGAGADRRRDKGKAG
jgi:hypothetical protein